MKKLLTSVLTLALVLCCFTFVGCKNDDNPGLTIGQTLEICERFVTDVKAVDTKISSQDYVYPTTDAQASAKQVEATDKSSIDIEYSNYDEFDYEYEVLYGYGEYLVPTKVNLFYNYALEDAEDFGIYIKMYKENNWDLGHTYKFYYDNDKDMPMYIQLINYNNTKISLLLAVEEDGETYYEEYIVNSYNDLSWKSFEYKQYSTEGDKCYQYIEKATDSDRVFDRYIEGDFDITNCRMFDIDEETQKIIYIEPFLIGSISVPSIQGKAYDYLLNLNIQNVQSMFHIENAIETEVYFDDYYV